MAQDIIGTLQAASAAVTGDQTPETVHAVQGGDSRLIWALVGMGPLLCLMVAFVIWALAFGPAGLSDSRAQHVARIGFGLCVALCLVVFRLAGSKRIEAHAGPAGVAVDA